VKKQMVRSGYEPENIHVVHSPAPIVKETRPIPDDDEIRFAFAGRIVPQKGLEWLINALSKTKKNIFLDIAGDGPALKRAQSKAEELELDDRIVFHGWIGEQAVHEIMSSARAIIFPSVWHEPAGLVTLEAAAHARPVIGTRVGGIPEYIDSDFGFLIDPHDTDALVDCIHRLAFDHELATTMGNQARSKIQSTADVHSYQIKIQDIYELYVK